jgi:flavorubredoxin
MDKSAPGSINQTASGSKSDLASGYDRPVEIGPGVFWIGFYDRESGLHCNHYLIVDGDEAVVIDGGSRPDFPVVMMKILQTGVTPSSIKALVYQRYDPDLCGSIPNFVDIVGNKDLVIISDKHNHMFIRHY